MKEDWQEIGQQFNDAISRIKHCQPLWADLVKKSCLFQERLKAANSTYNDYLDALQRIVDMSQWQEGGAKDLAPILTKMYVRQRNMERKLDKLTTVLGEGVNNQMKDKLKEWRDTVDYLDTKHYKDGRKKNEEVKKAVTETEKLKKKVMKKVYFLGKAKKQGQLADSEKCREGVMYNLQQFEQSALRGALIEERNHYCTYVSLMAPAWDIECDLMEDHNIRDIVNKAVQCAALPTKLPSDAEHSILKIRLVGPAVLENIPVTPPIADSARMSFVSTNSSSTSGVSSGSSYSTLPNSPLEDKGAKSFTDPVDPVTQFSSVDSLARSNNSYPGSDQAYGSSPSVCTKGIIADINKFVESANNSTSSTQSANTVQSMHSANNAQPEYTNSNGQALYSNSNMASQQTYTNSTMMSHCSPESNHSNLNMRRSGEYSSLSPIHNDRDDEPGETYENLDLHNSNDKMLTSQEVIDMDEPIDEPLYENLDEPYPGINGTEAYNGGHDDVASPCGSTENIYDVPPQLPAHTHPHVPQRASSFLCRRRSDDSAAGNENSVLAYMERRRSTISQNRDNEYSRPPSICSNSSTGNYATTGYSNGTNYNNGGGYAVQLRRSESYSTEAKSHYATQNRTSDGPYATQTKTSTYNSQPNVNTYNSNNNVQYNSNSNVSHNSQNNVGGVYNSNNSLNYNSPITTSINQGISSNASSFKATSYNTAPLAGGYNAANGGFSGIQATNGSYNGVQTTVGYNATRGYNATPTTASQVDTTSFSVQGVANMFGGGITTTSYTPPVKGYAPKGHSAVQSPVINNQRSGSMTGHSAVHSPVISSPRSLQSPVTNPRSSSISTPVTSSQRSLQSPVTTQTQRSGSRLSLQGKGADHPHYATMTARQPGPHKRSYSLNSLQHSATLGNRSATLGRAEGRGVEDTRGPDRELLNALQDRAAKVLSAVDPDMPPPPTEEGADVGLELSELCQQITQGGTLRPSQMRMLGLKGLKAGDSSTVRRNTKDKVNNFNTLCNMNPTQHVHMNK